MSTNLSRRSLLKHAAAGAAATVPGVALAAPDRSPVDPAQISDEDQLQNCIAALKAILARMHPAHQPPTHGDTTSVAGSRSICITVVRGRFEGDGLYEVEFNHGRFIHLCHVERHWSAMDNLFRLFAAPIFDGQRVAPREIIQESDIVRKVAAGEAGQW